MKKAAVRPAGRPTPAALPSRYERLKAVFRAIRPEWIYLSLALIFGGAFLVLTPPFQVPDEGSHFRRAFEISEGHIVAQKIGEVTGDSLPRSVNSFIKRFQAIGGNPDASTSSSEILDASEPIAANDREFVAFSNSAIHSPLTFLPQAVAILIAREISTSILVVFYAGRFLNLLAAVSLTALSIRITPILKWGFVALALTPMTVFLTASLSPDAFTNSISFLFIALILNCAFGAENRLSNSALVRLAMTGAALGLAKQAYFLLPLSYLIIPIARLGTKWRYWAGFAAVNGATFLTVLGWSLVVRDIYSPADARFGMNPREQIDLMLAEPWKFLLAIRNTATFSEFLGEQYLGWLGLIEIRLPVAVYILQVILLCVAFVAGDDSRSGPTLSQALLAIAVALAVTLTLLVVIHVTWDRVGSEVINLYGRYFIPIGPLVGIALAYLGGLAGDRLRRVSAALPVLVTVLVPVLLTSAIVRLCDRYFVDTPQATAARLTRQGESLFRQAGQEEASRPYFEQAVRLNPDNIDARVYLSLLLERTQPSEAIEHLRAVLRHKPDDLTALYNLANLLARQGEYPEAIRLFREAVRLRPDEERLKKSLDDALRAQSAIAEKMRSISIALEEVAKAGLLETRHKGEPTAGLYLKSIRGPVVNAVGRPVFPIEFIWRSPPPSGEEIRLFDTNGEVVGDGRRVSFYACAAKPAGANRIFVFPSPRGVTILKDEEMSWYFQVPLSELTADERTREAEYRLQHGLHFPLTSLPE